MQTAQKCLEIASKLDAVIDDSIKQIYAGRTQLVERMLANTCEICGSRDGVEVHHIRKLKDLRKKWQGRKEKPEWVRKMIAIRRKTLVVCKKHHDEIHAGNYDGVKLDEVYWRASCSESCTLGSEGAVWKSAYVSK